MTGTRRITVGDNLETLAVLAAGSVGLVYLDPPFNSGRAYGGFGDIWRWDDTVEALLATLGEHLRPAGAAMTRALVTQLGRVPLAAYLTHLAARLGHAHRLLADTGSLYLHVDPAASHYLKVVLDAVFGAANFRNEIVWRRTHAHSGSRRYGPVHDTILFYSRSDAFVWNQQYAPYSADYLRTYFRQSDERGPYQAITCTGPGDRTGTLAHYPWRGVHPPPGRHWAWVESEMERLDAAGRLVYTRNGVPRLKRYADDSPGVRLQDVWSDIAPLSAHSAERLGYDTQKPVALLDRVVAASSNPGDLVLDPYAGTGTTAVAAERLGRQWHVLDANVLAATLALARLRAEAPHADIAVTGLPSTVDAAAVLRRQDPLGYGSWATALLATRLDRRAHGPALAVGTRGSEAIGLVPLAAADPPVVRRFGAGFVVDGPGSAGLAQLLSDTGTPVVQRVPLTALVGPTVARTGRADVDLRLTG
jgi:DNA modification methylase